MLRLAFVFPGQGAQYVGMGRDLAENFKEAREVFKQADDVLGYSLSRVCFEGPVEELDRTEVTQPAILATSIAAFELLKSRGILPCVAAGLSLGEYSALVAAGALDLESALKLVAKRGRIMQEAVAEGRGMMAAVVGMDSGVVVEACQASSSYGVVSVANYNCPGQIVISGEKIAVEKAMERLRQAGGKVVPLAVSVPSHCLLMKDAAALLLQELSLVDWKEPSFPVISNVTAREIRWEEIRESLTQQLFRPVLWEQSVAYMSGRVDYFVEVGPGKVLSALIRKQAKKQMLGNVEDASSLSRLLAKWEEVDHGQRK
ncbi:MAG: ACP S-malonyltransferase [Syntrophothermus sp.]|uniref:ACP S-malonyltransferase n=1 Tax=Syntrophothermus sp. TaxID=2736299 RepID=UPI00257C5E31|nr:ACP S-malonyltransferase [Syntrophothermus sp.]NSW81984.1 ACP S-malonyltransferase [Syntrophothermus sp.]